MGSTWSLHINRVRLIVELQPLIEVHPAPASVRSVILNHVTGTYSTYTTSPPPGRALFHLTSIIAPLNDPFISETTGANENPAHAHISLISDMPSRVATYWRRARTSSANSARSAGS